MSLPKITLYKSMIDDKERIILKFPWNFKIQEIVKNIPGARWEPTVRGWHVEYSLLKMQQLEDRFKDHAILNFVSTEIDSTDPNQKCPEPDYKINPVHLTKADIKNYNAVMSVNTDNVVALPASTDQSIEQFKTYLIHRRYSESTIKSYCEAVKRFLKYFNSSIEEITNEDLIIFNCYLKENGLSNSLQNQITSGLKLFFERIQNKKIDFEKIERPRREHKLPNVVSKEEIRKLLAAPVNIKHRTMLSLLYACGLRRSELLNLRPSDIDSERGLIIIKQGKGNKDRIVPLPHKILEMLRTYYRACTPKKWLFEGQSSGNQYSPTSLAKILKKYAKRVGIKKPVSLHWLRHSYATHLLEQGTDLRIIQELLGHKSSKTTEIYTHVSTKNIQQVKSPFDDLDL